MAAEERIMLGLALTSLVEDHREWSDTTFGTPAERGPIGALKHLHKEAVEAYNAWGTVEYLGGFPSVSHHIPELRAQARTELADCLLLLLDANRRAGFTILELVEAAQAKMVVNRTRKYPKPTGDVPSEHVREIGGEG